MTQSLLLQRKTTGRVQAAQGDVTGCSQDDVSRKAAIRLQGAVFANLCRNDYLNLDRALAARLGIYGVDRVSRKAATRLQAAVLAKLVRTGDISFDAHGHGFSEFKSALGGRIFRRARRSPGLMTPNFTEISPTSSFASAASTASPGFLSPTTSLSFLPTPLFFDGRYHFFDFEGR